MSFFFDFIIFFILFFSAYWMYVIIRSFFYDRERGVKTKLMRICLFLILFVIFLIVEWGSFIEPQIIKVNPVSVDLQTTAKKENVKIALISDLHVGPYKKSFFVRRAVNKIIAQDPDVVLIAGDFILGKEKNARYLFPLKDLAAKIPVFAVTGNHEFNIGGLNDPRFDDRTTLLRKLLADWGIAILDNASKKIIINGESINITGIPDIWTGKADLLIAELNLDPRAPKILLAHNPDVILDKQSENFDLVLAAHTHGGQIRLPWIGPISIIPDKLGRKFDRGLFKLKNGYLFITEGIGETGPRARLFCPPEIAIINLNL